MRQQTAGYVIICDGQPMHHAFDDRVGAWRLYFPTKRHAGTLFPSLNKARRAIADDAASTTIGETLTQLYGDPTIARVQGAQS